jgi:hypothetical protein
LCVLKIKNFIFGSAQNHTTWQQIKTIHLHINLHSHPITKPLKFQSNFRQLRAQQTLLLAELQFLISELEVVVSALLVKLIALESAEPFMQPLAGRTVAVGTEQFSVELQAVRRDYVFGKG